MTMDNECRNEIGMQSNSTHSVKTTPRWLNLESGGCDGCADQEIAALHDVMVEVRQQGVSMPERAVSEGYLPPQHIGSSQG